MFPRKKKSAWLRKAKVAFWPFLTYKTASSKWTRTAAKFTLVVQNSSFLCHAEYCSIKKKEVESLNQLKCRIPLKESIFFLNSVLVAIPKSKHTDLETEIDLKIFTYVVHCHIFWGFFIKLLETVTLLITDLNLLVGVGVTC